MTSNVNQLISFGQRAAPDDPAAARKFFEKAVEIEPANITALLWLAGLAETSEGTLRYASRVLEIDPKNDRAKAAIRWARRRPRSAAPADRTEAAAVVPPPDRSSGTTAASLLAGLLGLIIVLCAGLITLSLLSQPPTASANAIAQVLPTNTPVPTFTATPTSTPTLPPTSTPTLAPTTTPQPPTATSEPTATPLPPTEVPLPTITPAPTEAAWTPPESAAGINEAKWIDVDLTQQRLVAYEGTTPVYWVTVSTGLPATPTVLGQYRTYVKYEAQTMSGPGYYLPDVPYVMYFYLGYGIHGTYWHNNFGQPMSHGCVNTPTPDAKWLYEWAPVGTLVNVHL